MEVRAEQFSTGGVEVRMGLGVEGGTRVRDYGCQGNSNLPQAWTLPTILPDFLVSVIPNE